MQVVYPRCCGLDIHKKSSVACVLLTDPDSTLQRFVRTVGTMTADLLALGDWLTFHEVTHVALESTGVRLPPRLHRAWREGRTLLLINAQHIKAVRGAQNGRQRQRMASGSEARMDCSGPALSPHSPSATCVT
jgi:transposase